MKTLKHKLVVVSAVLFIGIIPTMATFSNDTTTISNYNINNDTYLPESSDLLVDENLNDLLVDENLNDLLVDENLNDLLVDENLNDLLVDENLNNLLVDENLNNLLVDENLNNLLVDENLNDLLVDDIYSIDWDTIPFTFEFDEFGFPVYTFNF